MSTIKIPGQALREAGFATTQEDEEENLDLLATPTEPVIDLFDTNDFVSYETTVDPGMYLLSSSAYTPVTERTTL